MMAETEKRTLTQGIMEDFRLGIEPARFLSKALRGKQREQADMDSNEIADYALERANDFMQGCGVEALKAEGAHVDDYYYDTVALYVNMGDTYAMTLIYDTERETFHRMSWGDWLEKQETAGRYKFD